MKLMEFAIHHKLERDDKLLDYVAKNTPVPCSVLEDTLAPLIASLVDEKASMLLEDYAHMLQTYVPVTYQKGAGDTYHIQGNVPDNILESIELVHNVSANDAIAAMIAVNEETLQQHSTVTNVELLESAQRLRATPMPAIRQAQPIYQEPVYQEPIRQNVVQEPAYQEPAYQEPVESMYQNVIQNVVADTQVQQKAPVKTDTPSAQQLREQMVEVERIQEEARASIQQSAMDIDTIDIVPTVEEAQQVREPLLDNKPNLLQRLREIYQEMIQDIKQAGLDTSLGLQL